MFGVAVVGRPTSNTERTTYRQQTFRGFLLRGGDELPWRPTRLMTTVGNAAFRERAALFVGENMCCTRVCACVSVCVTVVCVCVCVCVHCDCIGGGMVR